MKHHLFHLAATILVFHAPSIHATTVLEERFNEDSDRVEYLNGAARGEAGSGVSAKPQDRAYVAAFGSVDPTDAPRSAGLIRDLGGTELKNYTMTLWYKSDRELRDPDVIVHVGGFYLLWNQSGSAGWTLRLPKWTSTTYKGPVLAWNTPSEWIFYAFTWDSESRTATIYQGTAADSATFHWQGNIPEIAEPNSIGEQCVVGNDWVNGGPSNRPFSGSIDNIRIFDKALDEGAVETVRAADTNNMEPAIK